MTSVGSAGLKNEQYLALQGQVKDWQKPDVTRPSVYDMPPDVTDALHAANIYTTTVGVAEADKPVPRMEYLERKNHESDMGTIAANTTHALQDKPRFAEAAQTNEFGHNTLGNKLAETFQAVTAITAHNVHVTRPKMKKGKMIDGTVVADRMDFAVSSVDKSLDLMEALQALLVTRRGNTCSVLPTLDAEGLVVGVQVSGLNEHMARALTRGVEALMAQEDRRTYGTVLPIQKLSLDQWKKGDEAKGRPPETLHPAVEARLQAADDGYKALTLKASYEGDPEIKDVTINKDPDYHLLGTDAAGALQGMRDIFNVRIKGNEALRVASLRGERDNPEQDPNKRTRLAIDNGTNLTRRQTAPEERKHGPVTGQRLSLRQQAQEKSREALEDAKDDPAAAFAEMADLVTDLGVLKLVLTGVKNIVLARRGLKQLSLVRDRLDERKLVQHPDYLTRRLSWLANLGPDFAAQQQQLQGEKRAS